MDFFAVLMTAFSILGAADKIIGNRFGLGAQFEEGFMIFGISALSVIGMLMQAWFPDVVEMLGVHLATLAVSAVIYRDAEEVADHNGESTSIKTALVTGMFFTVVMVICALIREVLGNATIWGNAIEWLEPYKISALAGAFGGYLVLAIVMAVINKITGLHHHLEENEEKEGN